MKKFGIGNYIQELRAKRAEKFAFQDIFVIIYVSFHSKMLNYEKDDIN